MPILIFGGAEAPLPNHAILWYPDRDAGVRAASAPKISQRMCYFAALREKSETRLYPLCVGYDGLADGLFALLYGRWTDGLRRRERVRYERRQPRYPVHQRAFLHRGAFCRRLVHAHCHLSRAGAAARGEHALLTEFCHAPRSRRSHHGAGAAFSGAVRAASRRGRDHAGLCQAVSARHRAVQRVLSHLLQS